MLVLSCEGNYEEFLVNFNLMKMVLVERFFLLFLVDV